jgi:proteasome assembly chaperone (PAC2) family protein
MSTNIKQEVVTQVYNATPSLAVVGAFFMSISINEWASIAGICFIGLQAAYLVWKWHKEAKKKDA